MRKIKCRGRDEKGKWHYGYYVDGYMFDDMLGLWETVPFIVKRQLEGDVRVDAVTVGQYTGLEDKNGKEIYEGDILKTGDIITQVVFEDYGWKEKLISSPLNHIREYFPFTFKTEFQVEVIGNIYESPELLGN